MHSEVVVKALAHLQISLAAPYEAGSVCVLQDAMRSPSLETSQDVAGALQPSCHEQPWRVCGLLKVCERWMSVIKVQAPLQLKLEFYSHLRNAGFLQLLNLSMGV